MAKQYILVSQGIVVFRTLDKKKAEEIRDKNNEEHHKYLLECLVTQEKPVDNEMFMYEEEIHGDLISRSSLLEKFRKNSIFEHVTNAEDKNVLQIIEEEPCDFDLVAVEKELENLQKYTWGITILTAEEYVKVEDLRKVIEIGRNGGKESSHGK